MALAGTSNLSSLNIADNLTVGGTSGFVGTTVLAGTTTVSGATTLSGTTTVSGVTSVSGATTFSGSVTFSGTPTLGTGILQPVKRFVAAGTVTQLSGFIDFNVAAAGFAVLLPAPVAGADFTITCHTASNSGVNTITIPAGGTIYQQAGLGLGTAAGSVLSFGTAGQAVRMIGLNSTQYQVVNNFGTVIAS